VPLQDDPLIEAVLKHCDPWEVVDLCDIDTHDLVDLLRSHILDNRERFEKHLELFDDWND
jgi:hypothetical protein